MTRLLLSFLTGFMCLICSAQDKTASATHRWEFSLSCGTNVLPDIKMSKPCIISENNNFRSRIEVARYFNSRYGVFAAITIGDHPKTTSIDPFLINEADGRVGIYSSNNTFQIGAVAKFGFGKFEIHPMLGIGAANKRCSDKRLSYSNGTSTDIIQYDVSFGARWAPVLTTGLRLGWSFSQHFLLFAEAQYDWLLTNRPSACLTVRDGYTGQLLRPTIKVPTRSPLIVGVGLTLFFERE